MEKKGWKITAIIFIILFTLVVLLLFLGALLVNKEEALSLECSQLCDLKESCISGFYDPDLRRCDYITKDDLKELIES